MPSKRRETLAAQGMGRVAVGPRALELVRDPAVGRPGEPIVGEHGPSAVAGETFESLAIVIDDHDACVQRATLGPRAEAVGAAHDVGGGDIPWVCRDWRPSRPMREVHTRSAAPGGRHECARRAAGVKLRSVFSPPWSRSRCHVAATRGENSGEQGGAAGKPAARKPAWSLQEREMVDGLGLRRQGSSPPARTLNKLMIVAR